MRIAVIGAGITGIASAVELAEAGHEVTVIERCDAVAEGASFAHAGLLTAGLVSPAAAPGLRRWLLRGLRHHDAALRWRPGLDPALYRWLWHWWRASSHGHDADVRAMTELAMLSLRLLDARSQRLNLLGERSAGVLVLMRHDRELSAAHRHAEMLRGLGWPVHELTAQACLAVEPHLHVKGLAGALHLPDDGVGNCRQMAQRLREHAEHALGVRFHFGTEVTALHTAQNTTAPGGAPQVTLELAARSQPGAGRRATDPGRAATPSTTRAAFAHTEPQSRDLDRRFDAVVCCAGADTGLLDGIGLRLPLQPVWGHAVTFRLRPDSLPLRSAVVDASAGVTLSRMGERLRVTGGFALGASTPQTEDAAVAPLCAALDRWVPHATERRGAQVWRGARPMLPHGPPVVGASGRPGVWLNLGHGAHGWTLASGCARLLAEQIGGRTPSIDPTPFAITRWTGP
jgi:D-amino-acid dehydrogenase